MSKIKYLIFVALATIFTGSAYGVPARPGVITRTLPDGTSLSLTLQGDECSHHYFSTDGYPVVEGTDGYFYYATLDKSHRVIKSDVRVSQIADRQINELNFLKEIDKNEIIVSLNNNNNTNRKSASKRMPAQTRSDYPTTGEQHALVVLVEYTDCAFTVKNPNEAFSDMMNKEGYSHNGATGSAKEYFNDVSNGQFKPTFDVIGPVTLAHETSYYGGNTTYGDARPEEMIIEACQLIDADIDFSLYDNDKDGVIDNVYVFYAGEGEASGGLSSTVWPHSWDIYDVLGKSFEFDGLLLNHYACSNEIYQGEIEGIGTFCHEFSHVLGLPDEYSTSYTSSFVPGNYSTLCYGCYNNDSKTPAAYTLYQRYALGWVEPTEIGEPAQHTLNSIASNTGYILRTSDENEYFLLENRQLEGWDAYIPGHGMLIWHIDYDENVWYYNQPNDNPSHQYIDIEEADNIQTEESRDADTFPGVAGITSFTDDTRPSSISWNYERLNKPITDIREVNGVIYFQVSGGTPMKLVEGLSISDITPVSAKATWNPVDLAEGYYLNVVTKEDGTPIAGYDHKDVGNVTSLVVAGLNPSTEYIFTVSAYNKFEETDPCEGVTVATPAPTFDMLSPYATEATNVTSSSFTANWDALEGATTYYINVYDKLRGEAEIFIADFTDGVKALPEGWTSSTTATYANEAYSGAAVPSLRMTNDRAYIESPIYDTDIRSLSFWHRGVGKSEGSEIVVYTYANNEWKEFDRISINNNEGGMTYEISDGEIFSKLNTECHAVRIEFIKMDTGSLALDDINIAHGGEVIPNYLSGFEGKNMGTEYSADIEGVASDHHYYYRVYANNEDINSALSNEVVVRTLTDNAVNSIITDNGVSIAVSDCIINITSDKAITNGCIYNMDGTLAAKFNCKEQDSVQVALPTSGVYIVTTNSDSFKIYVK